LAFSSSGEKIINVSTNHRTGISYCSRSKGFSGIGKYPVKFELGRDFFVQSDQMFDENTVKPA
jgi:hypothetical protein